MATKTINLTGAEVAVTGLDGAHAHIRNDGTEVIYAAKTAGITAGADGVASIPAGQSDTIRGISGALYLLGTGSVLIQSDDYVASPFKSSVTLGSVTEEIARAVSNPNLLINPDFMVNQRGKDSYTGTSEYTYTVDRWCIWKYNCDAYGTVTVNDDGSLSVDGVNGANDAILTQGLENGAGLVGKIVTLSMEIEEIEGSILVQQHYNASSGLTVSAPGIHKVTFEWQEATKYRITINNTNCSHYKIKWIKLETGTAATPFTLSDLSAELAKCQRYYQIHSTGDIAAVDLRPSMRDTPTITQLSDGNYAYSAEL